MDCKEKRKLILEAREVKEKPDMYAASAMFIKSRKLKNLTENTVASYSQALTKFSDFLDENGIEKINDIIVEDIQEFIQTKMDEGNSAPTINKYIRSLRAIKTAHDPGGNIGLRQVGRNNTKRILMRE